MLFWFFEIIAGICGPYRRMTPQTIDDLIEYDAFLLTKLVNSV